MGAGGSQIALSHPPFLLRDRYIGWGDRYLGWDHHNWTTQVHLEVVSEQLHHLHPIVGIHHLSHSHFLKG